MSRFIHQKPLILASGSEIRQKLMLSLGLEFQVSPSGCNEELIKSQFEFKNPLELGYKLAQSKALEVSQRFAKHYVIAADQLCVTSMGILDKPMNHETAIKHLTQLSGQTHQQIACLCIAFDGEILWTHHEVADLTLHPLSATTIEAYLAAEKPYHSCGAYQYESMGKWLFKDVKGHEDTILGLPLRPLIKALTELGICSLNTP